MADPTQNYVPKATADAKMFQDTANDLSIASAVKGTHASSTLYTNFDDLIANCNNALINTAEGGTQGVDPVSSGDFRGYPLPTVDMNYEVVHEGSFPDEESEALRCIPTLNNKVGFEVKLRVDFLEFLGAPPGSPVYLEWIFTFDAGSTVPDSVTRDGSAESATGGFYYLNQIYTQPGDAENITCIADYIFQSSYADIIFGSTDPKNVTLQYTASTPVYLLTDFYDYAASNCTVNPTIHIGDVYSTSNEVTVGDTLYSDITLSTTLTETLGATNVVGSLPTPTAHDWFTLTSGVVGSFNACP